uniref:Uncharacterized protein n=1 Tax=Opuntia streptacantha TaxID=393608 RepID=A0A7C9D7E0_OPUST
MGIRGVEQLSKLITQQIFLLCFGFELFFCRLRIACSNPTFIFILPMNPCVHAWRCPLPFPCILCCGKNREFLAVFPLMFCALYQSTQMLLPYWVYTSGAAQEKRD